MKHKIFMWLLAAFVVFYISSNPTKAATTAGGIGDWLAATATAFGDFFTALVGGGQ